MKELTAEQRDWILKEFHKHIGTPYGIFHFEEALNANTIEDECKHKSLQVGNGGLICMDCGKVWLDTTEDVCQSCFDPDCKDKECERSMENHMILEKYLLLHGALERKQEFIDYLE